MGLPLVARFTGLAEHLDIAKPRAERLLGSSVLPFPVYMARTALALIAVEQGDIAAAGEQYAALEAVRGILLLYVSTDRVLGLLAQTFGQIKQSIAHFEDALAFCRRAGYRTELAWSLCDYADVLVGAHGLAPLRDDQTKAMQLLNESLDISTDIGMRPLTERVRERLDRIESQRTEVSSYPSGLTDREVEVLRLIASGKTDQEIADELIISRRTVNNHVRSIFNKTAVANRAEAAAYAAREGLL